jgi:low temperature requirement protein LtrA
VPGTTLDRFKRWFWRPPRPHGEALRDRTVGILELHGREDGRTRSIVFVQMGILVLLAVYTADAGGAGGRPFALVYAAYLAVQTWLWSGVRQEDRRDHPEFLGVTGIFVAGLGVSTVVLLASALLPAGPRLLVWAAFAGASPLGWLLLELAWTLLRSGQPFSRSQAAAALTP